MFDDSYNVMIGRIIIVIATGALLAVLLFTIAFPGEVLPVPDAPQRPITLIDVREYLPPPPVLAPPLPPEAPPPPEPPLAVEAPIAETIEETEEPQDKPDEAPPPETPPAPTGRPERAPSTGSDYLPQNKLDTLPVFDERQLQRALLDAYPPIALRSGIAGQIIFEFASDSRGVIQRVTVLKEDPPGWGFAEATIAVFQGLQIQPAMAEGRPVSSRVRKSIRFTLK
jgi:protein TonB